MRLIIVKMKMKIMKETRYGTNRPTSRHVRKCSKYKKLLSMMILYMYKQYPSNI